MCTCGRAHVCMCVCTRVCPWGVHRCVRGWGKQWPTGSPSGLSTASPWPTCQESPTRRQSGAPAALGTFLHWGRQLSSVTVWKASHCSYRVLFEQGASDFLRSICSAWKRRKEGGEEGRKEGGREAGRGEGQPEGTSPSPWMQPPPRTPSAQFSF